jgi:site-specific DNA-methyltransferase (adenine-specific)
MKITDKITITNEDNMLLMARYPDNYFDLAIVDPPYGIGMGGGKIGNSKKDYKQFAGEDNSIPNKDYFEELFRVSKNQIIWGANYMIEHLYPTSCFLVWDKVQPQDFTMAMAEFAWTSFNSPAKICKKRIVGADEVRLHPTQKPIYLYKWILDLYGKEDFKILDTHLGSGSIAIACHDYGYELTACELDKEYYYKAIQRITNHTNQQKLF